MAEEKGGKQKAEKKKEGVQLPKIRKSTKPAAAGSEEQQSVSNDGYDRMSYISPLVPPTGPGWAPEGWTLVPSNFSMPTGVGPDTFGCFGDNECDEEDTCMSMDYVDMPDENLPGDGLLNAYRSRYQDEDGTPVSGRLAELVGQIWEKGKDSEVLKDIYSIYPRPVNVPTQKVDLNLELMGPVGKFGRARDMKLRAIQAAISRATVPSVRIADALLKGENIEDQDLMNMSIDSVTILANANESVNQMRRDLIRPSLDRKFQPLCSKNVSNNSGLLFGEDFTQQINTMNQGVKIGRGRRFPFQQNAFRKGRFQPYHQGVRFQNGYKTPFLGED